MNAKLNLAPAERHADLEEHVSAAYEEINAFPDDHFKGNEGQEWISGRAMAWAILLAEWMDLPSTHVHLSVDEGRVVITVDGYGGDA